MNYSTSTAAVRQFNQPRRRLHRRFSASGNFHYCNGTRRASQTTTGHGQPTKTSRSSSKIERRAHSCERINDWTTNRHLRNGDFDGRIVSFND